MKTPPLAGFQFWSDERELIGEGRDFPVPDKQRRAMNVFERIEERNKDLWRFLRGDKEAGARLFETKDCEACGTYASLCQCASVPDRREGE